jgi:hypothetical protein
MHVTLHFASWAVVSLALSALGCIASLALFALGDRYTVPVWGLGHAALSAALCFLGVFCGVVALKSTRRRMSWKRGMAYAGIVLGSVPLLSLCAAVPWLVLDIGAR